MEQKFSFKKLLSVFLVCAMLLSSFTFLAFANEPTNVALGSKYEIVGLTPSGSYPDTDNKELTDGARVEGKYNDSGWVGVILTGSVRSFDVVVTLGDGETVYDIDKIGDAMKEFTLRIGDGSETTQEALKTLATELPTMHSMTSSRRTLYCAT